MMILSFNSKVESDAGAKQVWVNMIEFYVAEGDTVLNSEDEQVTDLTDYTDDQIFALKVCSLHNGKVLLNGCFTITYDVTVKAYEVEKWYINEPQSQFLTDVVGYTIQTLPDSWRVPCSGAGCP